MSGPAAAPAPGATPPSAAPAPSARRDRASRQAGTDDAATPSLPALLFALLGGAGAWTVHLLAAYALVALDCSTAWSGGRGAIAGLTLVTLAVTAASALVARRLWLRARAVDRPTDDAWDARMGERTARVSFLSVVGLVLAGLFGLAIVYEAVPLLLVPVCSAAAP